jgi:hypothetical protein
MRSAFPLLLVASVALAAPVPKAARKTPDFFPTTVGTKWEYVREGTDTLDHTREVTESDEKDGVRTATVTWTSHAGSYGKVTTYRIDAVGIARVGFEKTSPFKVPYLMFKTDTAVGDSWDAGLLDPATQPRPMGRRGEAEAVDTPAGRFTALPVTLYTAGQNRADGDVYWYAADIGLVKWKQSSGSAVVLKTFIPAKEGKK